MRDSAERGKNPSGVRRKRSCPTPARRTSSPSLESLRIVVLCGGPGAEREVSLQSGAAVLQGLREAGLQATLLDVAGNPEEIRGLDCDLAFLTLHGEFGEDGTVQRLLEERSIPYTGSGPEACALAMDKDTAKKRFVEVGIPTPRWGMFHEASEIYAILRELELSLPVVVKPASRGSSVGTSIVRSEESLETAAAHALAFDRRAIVESYIPGREITAGILDESPLPLIELRPKRPFYTYEAKYLDEDTEYLCPAPLDEATTQQLQRLTLRVHKALGMRDLSRTDIILGPDGPQVLELNAIPGFTSHSLLPKAAQRAGISFPELCRTLVGLAWKRAVLLQQEKGIL